MKRPFEVGERVRVWGAGWQTRGFGDELKFSETVQSPWSAKVIKIDCGNLIVRRDGDNPGDLLSVYPQQCRRLVKKPRRRVWVSFKRVPGMDEHPDEVFAIKTKSDLVEFIERRGKR